MPIVGGKPVKAGTYTLFVIPNEQSWTIILNSQLGQWGAFDYEKYKDKDVLHVDVPVKKLFQCGRTADHQSAAFCDGH